MPVLNVFSIVIVVLSAFLWATKSKGRGLFSAFLALLCTIAAAAVAFAAWEPLVYGLLLDRVPDMAWGLGLLVPFLLTLAALRIAVDQVVKSNMDFDDVSNFVGGMLFGGASGYIAAGILVISVGFLRMPATSLGHEPVRPDLGNLVYSNPTWIRADQVVATAFEGLSTGAFATGTPLARNMPAAHLQAVTQREAFFKEDDGKRFLGRNIVPPGSVQVKGHYVISAPLAQLVVDSAQPDKPQAVKFIDGSTPSEGARLHGFVVQFDSRAQEKSGQVLIGPGQVRLLARMGSEVVGFHPVAIVATPEAQAGGLYRFRIDAAGVFIPSVGGGASAAFGFEFILPASARPTAMIVKNTRIDLTADPALAEGRALSSVSARDDLIVSGELLAEFGGGGAARVDVATMDRTGAITLGAGEFGRGFESIEESTFLPGGRTLNRGNRGSLTVNPQGNRIVDGQQKFRPADMRQRGVERSLVVQDFQTTADTTMVQLTLTVEGNFLPIASALDRGDPAQPIFLIDSEGRRFQAVGYYYEDGSVAEIRYTPGRPLQSLREYPELAVAKRDQTMILLFRPTKGVNIRYVAVGDRIVAEVPEPGLQTSRPR